MPEASQPRIVFFGTPDFAVASAEALWQAGVAIAAVVTAPDKPAGRGLGSRESAMKRWAGQYGIQVLQPEAFRDPSFLQALQQLGVDLFVVVAFKILPREVFTIPRLGTINLHAALLPKYRGAAPINWAIIEGETETGVTTFVINDKVDTGEILLQRRAAIGPDETFGELYERLKTVGADLLVETLREYAAGRLNPRPQVGTPTKAPKITPELCRIDWQQPAERIRNLVRGLSPVPAAFTTLSGKRLKVFRCQVVTAMPEGEPGEIVLADAKSGRLLVRAGEDGVLLQEIQLEGKKKMDAGAFLRGFPVGVGNVLA